MKQKNASLVIACGALSHEIEAIKKKQNISFDVLCLNANLHNNPQLIPAKMEEAIIENKKKYDSIFVAYADCGTGGLLDSLLVKHDIERLPGAHCYQFFSEETFENISDEDLGTFYLTDFLANHFERLVIKEFGIIDAPELKEMYFGNYTKLLYLIQDENNSYRDKARNAASYLRLEYSEIISGYGQLETEIIKFNI